MKKFCISFLIVLVGLFSFTGCSKDVKNNGLMDYVSYLQEQSIVGENENYTVIVDGGKKEEVFVDDGKVGKLVDFTKIVVVPKKQASKSVIEVRLIEGDKDDSIELSKDSFTGNYEKTIDKRINPRKMIIANEHIELKDVTNEFINKDKIMEIVKSELKEQIDNGYKDNKFNKEIYIKLVRDNNDINGTNYWYVAVIDGENKFSSILLDAKTGKVLSKKTA